jgi:hypothetical protein
MPGCRSIETFGKSKLQERRADSTRFSARLMQSGKYRVYTTRVGSYTSTRSISNNLPYVISHLRYTVFVTRTFSASAREDGAQAEAHPSPASGGDQAPRCGRADARHRQKLQRLAQHDFKAIRSCLNCSVKGSHSETPPRRSG